MEANLVDMKKYETVMQNFESTLSEKSPSN